MIKDLILKYKNVAFICNNKNDSITFIEESTKEIEFSKSLLGGYENRFIEDKEYLLQYHLRSDKMIFLIWFKQDGGYDEYQFYSRELVDYDKYSDWEKSEIINYSQLLRIDKIKKLKNEIIHKNYSM